MLVHKIVSHIAQLALRIMCHHNTEGLNCCQRILDANM